MPKGLKAQSIAPKGARRAERPMRDACGLKAKGLFIKRRGQYIPKGPSGGNILRPASLSFAVKGAQRGGQYIAAQRATNIMRLD